jgi:hypothetical protein
VPIHRGSSVKKWRANAVISTEDTPYTLRQIVEAR